MIKKAKVSAVLDNRAAVFFPDLDNGVSAELPVLSHVPLLHAGDMVLVAFCSNDFNDAAIIGKL